MTGSIFGRPEQWTGQPFSLEEIDDPANDSTPPISLRSLKSALRRRRRVWVTAAVIGLLLGAALHIIVPSKYAAVTRLYLVEPSIQAMQDDVTLLQTRSVETRATDILNKNAGSDAVLSPYKGLELSPSILEIKVSGKSAAEAVTQSNALATAFLRVRADVLSQQTQVLVNRAQDQVNAINARLQQLAEQINAFPSNPSGSQASQLAGLVNQRDGYSSQLTQLQNQVQQEKNTEASLTQGSTVLDPGRYVPASKKKVVIKDALAGLVAGLALGMVIVIIGALLSDRVRRRADVAAALGTTVELSVGHLPHPRFFAGPRLRRALKRPGPDLRRIEHRLRDHLESTPIAGLSLVEIGAGDAAALALAALGHLVGLGRQARHALRCRRRPSPRPASRPETHRRAGRNRRD
jgi:capsular polysaccharide biosynthesis protein